MNSKLTVGLTQSRCTPSGRRGAKESRVSPLFRGCKQTERCQMKRSVPCTQGSTQLCHKNLTLQVRDHRDVKFLSARVTPTLATSALLEVTAPQTMLVSPLASSVNTSLLETSVQLSQEIKMPADLHVSDLITRLPLEPAFAEPADGSSLPATATQRDETIYILAMICKAVPKCPDPDASLSW
jgi:hypothetical protein